MVVYELRSDTTPYVSVSREVVVFVSFSLADLSMFSLDVVFIVIHVYFDSLYWRC